MAGADPDHQCVYNQCVCGAMWLALDNTPPPLPGQQRTAPSGGGGGMFAKADARTAKSAMVAMPKEADIRAEEELKARQTRTAAAAKAQDSTIVDFRYDAQEMQGFLRAAGVHADKLQAVEGRFNLINSKLLSEQQRVKKKVATMQKLQADLQKAKKNQAVIQCGMALWKIVSIIACLLFIGLILSIVFGQV